MCIVTPEIEAVVSCPDWLSWLLDCCALLGCAAILATHALVDLVQRGAAVVAGNCFEQAVEEYHVAKESLQREHEEHENAAARAAVPP